MFNFKTRARKEIESLVELTQCLDNEVRGLNTQYHNLIDSFDAFVKELGYEIEIKKQIPRKVEIKKVK